MSTWEISDSNSSVQSNVKSRQVNSCENVTLGYVQACQPLYIDNLIALIKTGKQKRVQIHVCLSSTFLIRSPFDPLLLNEKGPDFALSCSSPFINFTT